MMARTQEGPVAQLYGVVLVQLSKGCKSTKTGCTRDLMYSAGGVGAAHTLVGRKSAQWEIGELETKRTMTPIDCIRLVHAIGHTHSGYTLNYWEESSCVPVPEMYDAKLGGRADLSIVCHRV